MAPLRRCDAGRGGAAFRPLVSNSLNSKTLFFSSFNLCQFMCFFFFPLLHFYVLESKQIGTAVVRVACLVGPAPHSHSRVSTSLPPTSKATTCLLVKTPEDMCLAALDSLFFFLFFCSPALIKHFSDTAGARFTSTQLNSRKEIDKKVHTHVSLCLQELSCLVVFSLLFVALLCFSCVSVVVVVREKF